MAHVMAVKILHLDLDAFYPSVEVLDRPELAGKAVIVGGLGNRGVVASASYAARAHGVHSAQPMALARRRCPNGVFLQPRFDRYRELSRRIFAIYRTWTELVEPLSIDEAYLDVSQHARDGREIARAIKDRVREETGLTVSAGVAHNKFLAKLASGLHKPDGLTCIGPDEAAAILAPLPVEKLWGVGPATGQRLRGAGYLTVGDVAAADAGALAELLGSQGPRLGSLARGVDDRRVEPPGRPKSISCEITFDHDLRSWADAAPHVRGFAERLAAALDRHDLHARTLVLKVRFPDFRTLTRSATPAGPLRDEADIRSVARALARRVPLHEGGGLRLIGLGVHNLVDATEAATVRPDRAPGRQLALFASPAGDDPGGG